MLSKHNEGRYLFLIKSAVAYILHSFIVIKMLSNQDACVCNVLILSVGNGQIHHMIVALVIKQDVFKIPYYVLVSY